MGLFTDEVQKTSVTLYIERLANYEQIDWYIFQQLTESILMQESGPREAIEAIRKRLKHGSTQEKRRVIEVLKLLVENTGSKFHRQLVGNEKMCDRFGLILSSPSEDLQVRKALLELLGTWVIKFKGEPGLQRVRAIYEGGRKHLGQQRTRPTHSGAPTSPVTSGMSTSDLGRQSLPPTGHRPAKTQPRSRSTSTDAAGHAAARMPPPFDLEAAKPKLIHEVAVANQNINNLINAIKFVNTLEDRWEVRLQHDARLQDHVERCRASRNKIVQYARVVEDEEWIGTLLATNEELLRVLSLYEAMAAGQVPAQLTALTDSPPQHHHLAQPQSPPATYTDTLKDLEGLQLSAGRTSPDSLDPFADPVTPVDDSPRRR